MNYERTAEFDAFGPWVLEVTTAEEVPRAFRGFPADFSKQRLLKIPRDIARREANPTMHLYDRMLITDANSFTVLERRGDSCSTTIMRLDTIVAVESGRDLLDGWLIVHSYDGAFVDVRYNGSSRTLMSTIADHLKPEPAPGGRSEQLALKALGFADAALVNAYNEVSARRRLHLNAAVANSVPRARHSRGLRFWRRRPRLSGLVLSTADGEMVVVSRAQWLWGNAKPDVSTRDLTLRSDQITGLQISENVEFFDVVDVVLEFGAARITLTVASDGAALEYLKQVVPTCR